MRLTASFCHAKLKQSGEQCFYFDVLTVLKHLLFEVTYPITGYAYLLMFHQCNAKSLISAIF